jgi:hypothetical protein
MPTGRPVPHVNENTVANQAPLRLMCRWVKYEHSALRKAAINDDCWAVSPRLCLKSLSDTLNPCLGLLPKLFLFVEQRIL